MTTQEKINAVQNSPELIAATKLLISAFIDCKLKGYIRYTYEINGTKYELNFMPIGNEFIYPKNDD